MNELEYLQKAVCQFSGMSKQAFVTSTAYWKYQNYKKGDVFNKQHSVCKSLGFVLHGVFRSYLIDEKTEEEKNVFLYSSNGFVVSFKSFINQIPCDYITQAMTDAAVLQIHITELQKLYQTSHQWDTFGRLLAQEAFNIVMGRVEGFLFKSPAERYEMLIQEHPDIFNAVPLYHLSSYLGIQGPSLSRIRKRISSK